MVEWLSPGGLIRAGLEVIVSGVFARFTDKREVEAGLPEGMHVDEPDRGPAPGHSESPAEVDASRLYDNPRDRDEHGALWIDFASDVGEGFDPTYTIAWLLSRPSLPVPGPDGTHETKRGRLLVLGGDQVYPSASWPAYRDRFVGPYRAALPSAPPEEAPDLYAIPGNHDWYDGLTSFMRLFTQGAWIGGWRTRQRRSYFALRLSEHWWLWGADTQFDTYMDGPQLDYFRRAAADFKDGHRVILVTAKPSWVNANPESKTIMKEGSWETLSYLENEVIRAAPVDAEVAVTLTGDMHHYARYQPVESGYPRSRITAGGGGAHTSATHGLPRDRDLREPGSDVERNYELRETSPSSEESLRLRSDAILGLATEWKLGLLIGAIYALVSLLIADGIKDQASSLDGTLEKSVPRLLWDAGTPWSIGLVALLVIGLWQFAEMKKGGRLSAPLKNALFGFGHGAAHVIVAAGLTIAGLSLFDGWAWAAEEGLLLGWIVAAGLFAVGFVVGRVILGLYFWLANRNDPRQHSTEIFGALASTEFKNFLRLRLDRDDDLTIYPVGVRTCPSWEVDPDGEGADPWLRPGSDENEPQPRLIEAAIPVSRG